MDKNGGKSRGFFKSFICLFVFCIYDDDLLLYGPKLPGKEQTVTAMMSTW